MRAAVQRRLVKIPALVIDPKRILELVLNIEQPTPIEAAKSVIGSCTSRNGPKPTSRIIVAPRIATATFVAIVLTSQCASVPSAVGAAR
jgi:hypothetical protein